MDHDAELLEERYKLRFSSLPMSEKLLKLFEDGYLVRSASAKPSHIR